MSKVKSTIITVLLAVAVAVAAFFAAISFPVGKTQRLNSIASNIRLGADMSGYAYTTVYPEGVLTAEEYNHLAEEDKTADKYERVGGLFVEKETNPDIDGLKADVKADAKVLNQRLAQKGYSSYSVAVEDGISIKLSVPTYFTYAAYKQHDSTARSQSLSVATATLSSVTAYGNLTLRTTDSSISLTDGDGNSTTYKPVEDNWYDTALVDGSKTYSLAGYDDVAEYFESISSYTFGSTSVISFHFTEEGAAKFNDVTTRAASSTSKTIYFFVGDRQIVTFSCESAINQRSLDLQANDRESADNAAITLNSAISGGALNANYREIKNVVTSVAEGGENAGLFAFIACIVVLVGLVVFSIIKYKKLGAVTSLVALAMALVEIYALYLLSVLVTFSVILVSALCIGLFMISNAVVFAEVKRLTLTGRTMQASVKEAYKNVIMTVSDMHIVLLVVAILLAAVGVGEVAACGLIAVVGVVASYVLYWFTRFMWYVCSSPAKDKFAFAGLKRVVYEDD